MDALSLVFLLLITLDPPTRWQCMSCSTYDVWRKLSMEEVLYNSQIVLYGRDLRRYEVEDTAGYTRTDSTFEVFCVFKQYGPIFRNITIQRIKPRDCSGTRFNVGEPVVLGVKRIGNGNFEWHELNTLQSAAFKGNSTVLKRVTNICGLGTVKLPYSRGKFEEPRCPKSRKSERYCTTGSGRVPAVVTWLLASCLCLVVLLCVDW